MAPLVRALDERPDAFEQTVCVTGQHREMLDQVLELFEIEPDIDLNLMKDDQGLVELTCRILQGMERAIADVGPDIVLVHGDTTTTFAASLAAFYAQIPLGHVEAGLRTGDLSHPWPEEANRKLTDALSEYFFAPTARSRDNLLGEGVPDEKIFVTGNTVIDALLWVREKLRSTLTTAPDISAVLTQNADGSAPPEALVEHLVRRGAAPEHGEHPLVLITGHRRENFGEGFRQIIAAIRQLAQAYPHGRFVYPVHLNPNVKEPVYRELSDLENVDLIPPLDYAPFVFLMDRSTLLLTDSGGIQEEAPSLGKPVLVMRDTTERPEALEAGTARLVGASQQRIVEETSMLLDHVDEYEKMARASNPFGDGHAALEIVEILDV